MKAITLVFPHQLFAQHPALAMERPVYLVEEWLFFKQYQFHQQKIVLHRASMKSYAAYLEKKDFSVTYIDAQSPLADCRKLIDTLFKEGTRELHFASPTDNWLSKRINSSCAKNRIGIVEYDTPYFLNTLREGGQFFDNKKTYFQTAFYTAQRKQRNILLDARGEPEGGQWSFDADNRLRYPKNAVPPPVTPAKENNQVAEAKKYVTAHFSGNPGTTGNFAYPVDFDGANKWLEEFFKLRFAGFGSYEDAIVSRQHYLHHSVISPLLNTGLLLPQQVIEQAMQAATQYKVPLNSLEGFIRQMIGWREFIRLVYEREGSRQRTKNYWGFTRKIPASFYTGETGIFPIDNVIKKILTTGYCHHIERLMVLGNFMLLCEFDPDEVYRWFMELFIDAYDWVMVPNVYGMTQFADGGLMTTKPYISGSNYLLKMSDYPKGDWTATWDGLFWRFMDVHRDFFSSNPRLGMLLKTFDKMPAARRDQHLTAAEGYLASLDAERPA